MIHEQLPGIGRKSDLAFADLYIYNPRVFEIIQMLNPSYRGELEITDVNNEYIHKGEMSYSVLEEYWIDAGTFESLFRASEVKARIRNNGN